VRAFRERLGLGGVRDLIEHRPLEMNDEGSESD
jgi:putative ABC transport system ATP-binding protein